MAEPQPQAQPTPAGKTYFLYFAFLILYQGKYDEVNIGESQVLPMSKSNKARENVLIS